MNLRCKVYIKNEIIDDIILGNNLHDKLGYISGITTTIESRRDVTKYRVNGRWYLKIELLPLDDIKSFKSLILEKNKNIKNNPYFFSKCEKCGCYLKFTDCGH